MRPCPSLNFLFLLSHRPPCLRVFSYDLSTLWEEVQKRTAEYPPALRSALPRNGSRNTHRRGGSISNLLEGIAGRSNNEFRTPKDGNQVFNLRHSKFLVGHSTFGFRGSNLMRPKPCTGQNTGRESYLLARGASICQGLPEVPDAPSRHHLLRCLRSLLLAAYCSIRLTRRSLAPCI
jgi:hypothetical protein